METINKNLLLTDALILLEKLNFKTLFVIDDDFKLFGSITDGDIRRYFIENNLKNSKISFVCNKNPIKYTLNTIPAFEDLKTLLKINKLSSIPIVDENNVLIKVINESNIDIYKNKSINTDLDIIIMAGVKGTRLKPFTDILPKPLVPYNGKTMVENIIDYLNPYGFSNFTLSLNSKAEIIKAYFENLNQKNFTLNYIFEPFFMGTIGSVGMIKNPKENLLVTNCDILIKSSFDKFYNFHKENKFDLTLIASQEIRTIPDGECVIKNNLLIKIKEKPSREYLASIGFYIFKREILEIFSKDQKFDITDLFEIMIERNYRIGVFQIEQNEWIDVGQWNEYIKIKE